MEVYRGHRIHNYIKDDRDHNDYHFYSNLKQLSNISNSEGCNEETLQKLKLLYYQILYHQFITQMEQNELQQYNSTKCGLG